MACEFGSREIAAYGRDLQSDDPAARGRRRAFEAHLETCADCQRAVAEQRDVESVLAARPRLQPSAHFTASVMSRLDDAAGFFGLLDWRLWTFRLAPVAVAMAIVALFLSAPAETGAASAGSTSVTIDEWAQAQTAVNGEVPPWQANGSAEALLESMLPATSEAEGGDGR
jgi:hypothetical protein